MTEAKYANCVTSFSIKNYYFGICNLFSSPSSGQFWSQSCSEEGGRSSGSKADVEGVETLLTVPVECSTLLPPAAEHKMLNSASAAAQILCEGFLR